MSGWTEERVAYAMRRWKEGGSGAEIASELSAEAGGGFTKNSVICKMYRLGLAFQGGSRDGRSSSDLVTRVRSDKSSTAGRVRAVAKAPKADRPAKEARPAQSRAARLVCEAAMVPPQMPETTFYGSDAVQALQDSACKWPVGDPLTREFRFCCAPQASGFPYCAFHARMAYAPSSRRAVSEPAPLRRTA